MKKISLQRQNIRQLIIVLIAIVLINVVVTFWFFRLDLTSEKRYTLSNATHQLLEQLNEEVTIRVYLDGEDLPISFKRLQQSIEEILQEFAIYANDNLVYEFVNPSESTDPKLRENIQKELEKKGLIPYKLRDTDHSGKTSSTTVFPGAEVIYKGYEISVNLLKNNKNTSPEQNLNSSIEALEYELTNAIRKLDRQRQQRIAFIEGHGELSEVETMSITRTLSEYYDVQRGRMGGQLGILDSFAVVIVAKPVKPFDEADKLVIDQYIMNGGKVLWLLDGATADMDSLAYFPTTIGMANEINLDDQLFRYGVRVNYNMIQDLQCAPIGMTAPSSTAGGQPRIELFQWYYFPIIVTQNSHSITRYINVLRTDFISTLDTVGASAEVQKTILLKSSRYSQVIDVPNRISLDIIEENPDKNRFRSGEQPVAVLLEGTFTSVFRNRLTPETQRYSGKLKEKSEPTRMIVVSDGDVIRNEVSSQGQPYPLGFDRYSQNMFDGNREFILNAINYLCDDDGLMQLRTRELKMRLLNRDAIVAQRATWQMVNTLIPLISLTLFGILVIWLRRRRYTIKQ